ncbi:MAG: 1,6-anhydro-N-acetylmuramyl-L-alanine amidase AmpD [Methylophaga sp.]|nr:1,6-anhydro-N-acetylmuramyl-L-alanine amidase AmpD [Methylophaga sp.]
MEIEKQSGWLVPVTQLVSPNYDERPDVDDICGIIIHNISLPPGEFGGPWIADLFLNRLDVNAHPYFAEIAGLKVSSHLLIRRDGEVQQFVPFTKRAWHAGQSCWQGRERCNDFTIGIEMEGDDFSPFADEQYQQLASVIKLLIATYPKLTTEQIAGHEHIAPGRKTDPGPFFDWQRLQGLLQA